MCNWRILIDLSCSCCILTTCFPGRHFSVVLLCESSLFPKRMPEFCIRFLFCSPTRCSNVTTYWWKVTYVNQYVPKWNVISLPSVSYGRVFKQRSSLCFHKEIVFLCPSTIERIKLYIFLYGIFARSRSGVCDLRASRFWVTLLSRQWFRPSAYVTSKLNAVTLVRRRNTDRMTAACRQS
jgi:hypothetical protein